ncbi:MAG: FAD:protein FMN transferase [Clostridium perfringens]|nr:FAD:protein FMN transferase [Clostridium perfringens]
MLKTNFRKITIVITLLILLFITIYKSVPLFLTTTSASKNIEKLSTEVFAMDTVMSITTYNSNEDVLNLCKERILELENLFSVTDESSEIFTLNTNKELAPSKDTYSIIKKAVEISNETNGALDISIYPILKAWGFTTGNYNILSTNEINNLLDTVNYRKINLGKDKITLPYNMEIDLGGVAKGYTSNELIKLLKENDIESALINLGGNVHTLGSKVDGTPWKVAIKSPTDASNVLAISVIDKAVITSGAYERYFTDDLGNKYGHIIDPKTGKPTESDLLSVTIIGDDGVLCDALSTSLFVLSLDDSINYYKNHNDFEAIFITIDNELYITEGIKDDITLLDNYSNITPNIINR